MEEKETRLTAKKKLQLPGRGTGTRVVMGAVVVLVLWSAFHGVKKFVVQRLVKPQLLNYRQVTTTVSLQGLLLAEETAVASPLNGEVAYKVREGERVAVHAPVVEVRAGDLAATGGLTKEVVTSPAAGLVSFQTDGLEGILNPDNLDALPLEKLDKITSDYKQNKQRANPSPKDGVNAGALLFKIVNNLEPVYIYGRISRRSLPAKMLQPGQEMQALLGDGQGTLINLTLEKFKADGKNWQILWKSWDLPDDDYLKHLVDMRLITGKLSGLIVPASAIVRHDNHDGVYTLYKETVVWRGVQILGELDGQVAIRGLDNLNPLVPGTVIIANPKVVQRGQELD